MLSFQPLVFTHGYIYITPLRGFGNNYCNTLWLVDLEINIQKTHKIISYVIISATGFYPWLYVLHLFGVLVLIIAILYGW